MDSSLISLENEIIEVGKRAYARGYVAANDGNISVRLDKKQILITPTGVSKGFMRAAGFAVAGIPLDQNILSEAILTLGKIPVVEYGTPRTEECYKSLIPLLKNYDAFLLANHGALTVGIDILNAYYKMETVEHLAQISFIAKQLGTVQTLNDEQVQKLYELRKKFGIRKDIGSS